MLARLLLALALLVAGPAVAQQSISTLPQVATPRDADLLPLDVQSYPLGQRTHAVSAAGLAQYLLGKIPLGPQGIPGNTGPVGPANSLSVGTVSASDPGSNPLVSIVGTAPSQILNFTFPRGAPGPQGPQGLAGAIGPAGPQGVAGPTGAAGPPNTLSIGTVGTSDAGAPAAASVSGAAPNQALNLTLPRGIQGPIGPVGPTGNGTGNVLGPSGGSTATHIATFSDTTGTRLSDGGVLGTAAAQPVAFFAQAGNNLSDLASSSAARLNLGLGTLAVRSDIVALDSSQTQVTIPNSTGNPGVATILAGKLDKAGGDASGTLALGRTLAARAADRINVKDLGAKGDGVSLSDGTIAAGSTTFTSQSAFFMPGDLGKPIDVPGAGSSGGLLSTTIVAVSGPHTITLATQASTIVNPANSSITALVPVSPGTGYAPGDTFQIAGGASSAQAVGTVTATTVNTATTAAAGSGGTAGKCILTGTTGTGTLFRVAATIANGSVSTIDAVLDGGAYTANPTTPSAEPVTSSCGLTGAKLALGMGVGAASPTTIGVYTVQPSYPVAQASTSGNGSGAMFLAVPTAQGTFAYGSDDGPAWAGAINQVNAVFAATGTRQVIYAPPGHSFIATAIPPFGTLVPGAIKGDGRLKSFVMMAPRLSGDLFAWSEAWGAPTSNRGTYQASTAWNGAEVEDISLVALNAFPANPQNALMFYDRNDFVHLRDVDVMYFNGACLSIGKTKNQIQAYMRESKLWGLRCWSDGSATTPAVLIDSSNTSATLTADATNEVSFYGLDVFGSNGKSIVIQNTSPGAGGNTGTRLIRFFGPRVEGGTDDFVTLGNPTSNGVVSTILFDGLEENSVPGNKCGIVAASTNPSMPSNVRVQGVIGSGVGRGACVQSGADIKIDMAMAVQGFRAVVWPSSLVTGPIYLDGNGAEGTWSAQIDSSSLNITRLPAYTYGAPKGRVGFALSAHDNSPSGGAPIGAGSVDLQSYGARFSASQSATGAAASILGGQSNSNPASFGVVGGGLQNNNSSFFGFIGSGNQNTNGGGSGETICGGQFNYLLGAYSSICGGQYAFDRNRYAWQGFAGGQFSTMGDAQVGQQIMRGTGILSGSATVTVPVTADAGIAGASNTNNLTANGLHYHMEVSGSCTDTTTTSHVWASWDGAWGDADRKNNDLTWDGAFKTATTPNRPATGPWTSATMQVQGNVSYGLTASFVLPAAAAPAVAGDVPHCVATMRNVQEIQ